MVSSTSVADWLPSVDGGDDTILSLYLRLDGSPGSESSFEEIRCSFVNPSTNGQGLGTERPDTQDLVLISQAGR